MQVIINGNTVTLPTSLSEITLGQRIDFYHEHGKELDEMLGSILVLEDGLDKELELIEYQAEKMFRTFAFFTGTTPEALKESEFVDDIANIYYSSLSVLLEDEQKLEPATEFIWNGEVWVLQPHELKHGSKMQFGELIDAKQLVKDMMELGKGKWEYMVPLCAIFFRKKDEEYQEEFLFDGSERQELMKSLPLDIALHVGFFLTSSINSFINTFQSSRHQGPKDPVEIVKSILNDGVGSTS